ncbi:hypothetical protein [Streptomyces narbonensis]|uniref:hypothetical protein n=1 Tax=Streptomyces narbonensis TaxID=67333 RepID=UPI001677D55A|nr:hypothetical protein [Streptomyces narbonensis]
MVGRAYDSGAPTSRPSRRLLRPGRVIVLATMRSEEFRRYDAREESRLTGSDRDAWRVQRGVLDAATKIRLERHWSEAEQLRAAAHREDPRIRLALESGDRFGLAEVVAAGPELLSSWQNAWAPGTNPRGAAVVAAAVDCRRSGLRRPVSREWLQEQWAFSRCGESACLGAPPSGSWGSVAGQTEI